MIIAVCQGADRRRRFAGLRAALDRRCRRPRPLRPLPFSALLSYGVSLALFVLALRDLGAARTGAYFAIAPFRRRARSAWAHEPLTPQLAMAGVLMALGVYLHLTERHEHVHAHEMQAHDHPHRHDEHHRHRHDFPWDGTEPHTHSHVHDVLVHRHPHYPDIHHRH